MAIPLCHALVADPPIPKVDVAIIGGGLSGLSTAKGLAAANKSFAILEARDRVGGRVLNANLTGKSIQELDAEYVGPTQNRVLALATELGLPTYKTYTVGNSTFYRNGTARHYQDSLGGIPPVGLDSLIELAVFMNDINTLASTVDLEAPWNTPNATTLDSMTLETYVNSRLSTADSRVLLNIAIPAILSTELREPSLLYSLWCIAAAGDETGPGTINRLIGVDGGAQDSRVSGGTQLLATLLAEILGSQNIYLNSPVRKVQLKESRYLVSSDKVTISARHVVVAMSPPLVTHIAFDPPLPAGRDQLNQRMPLGALGKAIAIFPSAWWRDEGLNGEGVSDTGAIRVTYDNSPAGGSFGAIMGFIEADEMRKLDTASEDEVKRQVKESFANLFGPRMENATDVLVQRWDLEEFSRGGPSAFMPPGVLTQYGSYLRAPSLFANVMSKGKRRRRHCHEKPVQQTQSPARSSASSPAKEKGRRCDIQQNITKRQKAKNRLPSSSQVCKKYGLNSESPQAGSSDPPVTDHERTSSGSFKSSQVKVQEPGSSRKRSLSSLQRAPPRKVEIVYESDFEFEYKNEAQAKAQLQALLALRSPPSSPQRVLSLKRTVPVSDREYGNQTREVSSSLDEDSESERRRCPTSPSYPSSSPLQMVVSPKSPTAVSDYGYGNETTEVSSSDEDSESGKGRELVSPSRSLPSSLQRAVGLANSMPLPNHDRRNTFCVASSSSSLSESQLVFTSESEGESALPSPASPTLPKLPERVMSHKTTIASHPDYGQQTRESSTSDTDDESETASEAGLSSELELSLSSPSPCEISKMKTLKRNRSNAHHASHRKAVPFPLPSSPEPLPEVESGPMLPSECDWSILSSLDRLINSEPAIQNFRNGKRFPRLFAEIPPGGHENIEFIFPDNPDDDPDFHDSESDDPDSELPEAKRRRTELSANLPHPEELTQREGSHPDAQEASNPEQSPVPESEPEQFLDLVSFFDLATWSNPQSLPNIESPADPEISSAPEPVPELEISSNPERPSDPEIENPLAPIRNKLQVWQIRQLDKQIDKAVEMDKEQNPQHWGGSWMKEYERGGQIKVQIEAAYEQDMKKKKEEMERDKQRRRERNRKLKEGREKAKKAMEERKMREEKEAQKRMQEEQKRRQKKESQDREELERRRARARAEEEPKDALSMLREMLDEEKRTASPHTRSEFKGNQSIARREALQKAMDALKTLEQEKEREKERQREDREDF
ncbi:hypothetical protein PCG10_001820 [Penicillium crustosum]|uniref:Amine oxidase n=1 Tax=Penicillium crustosum TaxID=36656 RepID=A0A9P5L717_PENCR|nr:hypothetical protein PCG10_001820 [Penicillium crustosum]